MVNIFINKIKKIVLNHLEDESFGVRELSSELGLSRSQTLRKVKAATGKSARGLIREIRLKEGAKLIRQSDLTIAEISYKVGFNSPSYFNKCFHKYFSVTPGEYKQQPEAAEESLEISNKAPLEKPVKLTKYIYIFLGAIVLISTAFMIVKNIMDSDKKEIANGPAIAVLAFTDLSPENDHEWFSDGISEELQSMLMKIPELRVISSTSSFTYKEKNKTAKSIGKELKVTHILEGSVRKSGDTLRVQVQLVNAEDGTLAWSETYDRSVDELLNVQNEIAYKVTEELKINLLGSFATIKPIDSDAYTAYLRAKYLLSQHTDEGLVEAEKLIIKSIHIDSTYAPSWNLLSRITYELTINLNLKSKNEGLKIAKNAAQNSLIQNKEYAPAYASLCKVNLFQWDFTEAEKNIKKALSLDHRDAYILYTAALHAEYSGRLEESVDLFLQALKIDPFENRYYLNIGIVYYFLNRLEAASINIHKFNDKEPDAAIHHAYLSKVLVEQGRPTEALAEAKKETNKFWNLYAKNFALFALGREKEADSVLIQFIEKYGATSPANLASLYAFRGENDHAFIWLDMAFQKPDTDLIEVLNYPDFKTLYQDPRWHRFITKMNLPENHWLRQKKE